MCVCVCMCLLFIYFLLMQNNVSIDSVSFTFEIRKFTIIDECLQQKNETIEIITLLLSRDKTSKCTFQNNPIIVLNREGDGFIYIIHMNTFLLMYIILITAYFLLLQILLCTKVASDYSFP